MPVFTEDKMEARGSARATEWRRQDFRPSRLTLRTRLLTAILCCLMVGHVMID